MAPLSTGDFECSAADFPIVTRTLLISSLVTLKNDDCCPFQLQLFFQMSLALHQTLIIFDDIPLIEKLQSINKCNKIIFTVNILP